MAVIVDYRCRACGSTVERVVPSPPTPAVPCETCGGTARRSWGPMALGGRARQPSIEPAAAATGPLCRTNQDIPGLCSFSPTAARAFVARARGDNRALERELAYQEHMQKESPGTLTVGGHAHGHDAATASSAESHEHQHGH
jgi:hypothetical protein